jgi:hypothetical protein
MTDYLLATVNTDVNPYRGKFAAGEIIASTDVIRRLLDEILRHHGHVGAYSNAQMIGEAETATARIGHWHGEPMRLCGYLTRYDVYPVTDIPALPLQDLWTTLADRYEQDTRDKSATEKCRGLGISPDDADYREVHAWLAQYEPYDAGMKARNLARFHDLALWPDVAPHLAAYRPWQWALATAITGDLYDIVERELLSEIASKKAAR